MDIKENFNVESINRKIAKPWILKKHYASRLPSISYYFGLYYKKSIVGVCTFGQPPAPKERKNWSFDIIELNRLITEDDLPKNALSYFVSQCLNKLPKPLVVLSYADPNNGHHGYIYQATNWIYVGQMKPGGLSKIWILGDKEWHGRHMMSKDVKRICGDNYDDNKSNYENFRDIGGEIINQEGKYKYYYFLGNKREKKQMKKELRYEPKPYPKGDNEEYDTGDKLHKQQRLF